MMDASDLRVFSTEGLKDALVDIRKQFDTLLAGTSIKAQTWPGSDSENDCVCQMLKDIIDATFRLQEKPVDREFQSEEDVYLGDAMLSLFRVTTKRLRQAAAADGNRYSFLRLMTPIIGRELLDVWLWRSLELNYIIATTNQSLKHAIACVVFTAIMTRSPKINYKTKSGSEDSHKLIASGIWSSTHLLSLMYAGQAASIVKQNADAELATAVGSVVGGIQSDHFDMPTDRCHQCGTTAETLMTCAKCRIARYCSRECQKAAWKGHKADCALLTTLTRLKEPEGFLVTARGMLQLYVDTIESSDSFSDWESSAALGLLQDWDGGS
eukprot:TRINITY_DN12113_c0_g1_i2.p2 TRINITY_DN12113_c0_g1~~TRINITY_DN12113_c0_g1_i2.p2  ORF type:complete len:325 (+),score=43.36 TRINITY_DN12113_c0_g1_i2:1131-2105(+)